MMNDNDFKQLEESIFQINDKGNTEDKLRLFKILKNKLEIQKDLIECISVVGDLNEKIEETETNDFRLCNACQNSFKETELNDNCLCEGCQLQDRV